MVAMMVIPVADASPGISSMAPGYMNSPVVSATKVAVTSAAATMMPSVSCR